MSEAAILAMAFGLGVAIVLIKVAAIERRLHRLSRLDAKIDALLNHAGIRFDEFRDVPPEVRDALERGETILAIKRFREATGAGLRESKEFVDELRRRKAPPGLRDNRPVRGR